jgi:hypothetical protein
MSILGTRLPSFEFNLGIGNWNAGTENLYFKQMFVQIVDNCQNNLILGKFSSKLSIIAKITQF